MNQEAYHQALAYLRTQWGDRAPADLEWVANFQETPLEGEGPVSLFRFAMAMTGKEPDIFFVVAGRTQPNYYPDWGLTADDLYALHIGTRFMLVMEVSQIPDDRLPADAASWFQSFMAQVAPHTSVDRVRVAAGFLVDQARYLVAHLMVADEPILCVGYEAPPGIYRDVHLPPHVVLRRHLGQVIRHEARQEAWRKDILSRRPENRSD